MTVLKIAVLGGFEATAVSGSPVTIPTKKAQALLAYCAATPGRHQREKLATLLWGDSEEDHARNSLRQSLFVVRNALGRTLSRVLDIEGDTIAVRPDAVQVDAVRFQELATQDTPRALEAAAQLYKGDLLDGFLVDEEGFEEWLTAEREHLRDLAFCALGRLFRHQCGNASPDSAVQTARRLLSLNPLDESVHRELMLLLERTGRRDAALRQYERCADVLKRELNVDPQPSTRQIYARLLAGLGMPSRGTSKELGVLRGRIGDLKRITADNERLTATTAAKVQAAVAAAALACERARVIRDESRQGARTLWTAVSGVSHEVKRIWEPLGGERRMSRASF